MMVLETETCSLIWDQTIKKRCVRLNNLILYIITNWDEQIQVNSACLKIRVYHLVIVYVADSQQSACLLIVKDNNLNVKFVDSYNPYSTGVFVEHLVRFSGCPLVEITSSLINCVLCDAKSIFSRIIQVAFSKETQIFQLLS
jgi:hypothetical protein